MKKLIYPLQQFLYELVFARDINEQFTYMHQKPFEDGFKAGMRRISKNIKLTIKQLEKDKKDYPTVITDELIIKIIKNNLII